MNISDLQCGKAGEYLVCADLILNGYVAFPSEQGLPYDIVLDAGSGLIKIQVKTTRVPLEVPQRSRRTEAYLFHVMRSGKAGKKKYERSDVDIFALVALDRKLIAYIPKALAKTTMQFRSYDAKYQGDGKPELLAKCKAMRESGSTLKEISESTGKHVSYVSRLLIGKEDNPKFGRYLHDFPIKRAIAELD